MLDELEECQLRPVDVVEVDNEGLPGRLSREQLPRCPEDLVDRVRALRQPDGGGYAGGDVCGVGAGQLLELRERLLGTVGVLDRRGLAQHLEERPEGDAAAV